jgi:hypothetical protein
MDRSRHERRLAALKNQRAEWEPLWRELADYIAPERLRLTRRENTGKLLGEKIIDETGTFAWRTLSAGLMTGLTSPSRPWFRLQAGDAALNEYGPVKVKIGSDERRLRQAFAGSNFYNALQTGYGDLALFGQFAALMVEDEDRLFRLLSLTTGDYWIAANHQGTVDTLYRRCDMTVEQMVQRFKDRVSTTVMNLYDRGQYDEWIPVYHAVEPRRERDITRADRRNKKFLSNYWEEGESRDALLEESGFDENPILAPRWDVIGSDHWGRSAAMVALPGVKQLQVEQSRKGEAIDKMVRPPMQGPPSMKNNPKSLLPGAITYVDDPTGRGFRPAMEVRLSVAELAADIREVQERVRQAFYADLFLMISTMDGIQPRNQFEIAERREEKLLALGPVIERLQNELLRAAIDRGYAILDRRGALEPPPPELEGQELEIDYISTLAQAQKAAATGTIERFWGFVGNLAGMNPAVLDKADADQSIDEYAEMVGVPASIVRSDDAVEQLRAERAAAQEQQMKIEQMAAMAPVARQGAEAAKVLAETDAGGENLAQKIGLA